MSGRETHTATTRGSTTCQHGRQQKLARGFNNTHTRLLHTADRWTGEVCACGVKCKGAKQGIEQSVRVMENLNKHNGDGLLPSFAPSSFALLCCCVRLI